MTDRKAVDQVARRDQSAIRKEADVRLIVPEDIKGDQHQGRQIKQRHDGARARRQLPAHREIRAEMQKDRRKQCQRCIVEHAHQTVERREFKGRAVEVNDER